MRLFRQRGKRIRPHNESLFLQFTLSRIVAIWLLSFIIFHLPFLLTHEWQLSTLQQHFISTYGLTTSCISIIITCVCVYLYCRYRYDKIRQVLHRQKLAKMVLENGWYETKQIQSINFFEDTSSSKTKEKISYFPKIYYRLEKGLLYIQVGITLGKYQEQLLNLEKKLESGLYCELVSTSYKKYFSIFITDKFHSDTRKIFWASYLVIT